MKSTSLPDLLRVSGAMLMNLKTQELMHGFESPGIGSTDRDPPSSIGLGLLVGQEGPSNVACQERRAEFARGSTPARKSLGLQILWLCLADAGVLVPGSM